MSSVKHDVARETQRFTDAYLQVEPGKPHADKKGLRMTVKGVKIVDGCIERLDVEWSVFEHRCATCFHVDPRYPVAYPDEGRDDE